ncbi:MAG: peptidase [Frankiales bacterium]|nr:peptidase [Frankiales bacterium]
MSEFPESVASAYIGRMTSSVERRELVVFPGISSRAYEHPADRTALTALRKLEGFDTLLRKLAGLFNERSLRLLYMATGVRASEKQFGYVHAIVVDACRVLDITDVPDVFVVQDPRVSAMAIGVDRPWLVVTSGALDLFDADELRFVLGHEVGHILSGHSVYRTMLFGLIRWSTRIAWFPIGALGVRAAVVALEEWFRKSELSCDRAGLLAGQDVAAALRVHMKMAGGSRWHEMDTSEFLAQARDYESAGDVRDGVAKILHLVGQTHPFATLRAAELQAWATGGQYAAILAGDYPRRVDDAATSVTEEAKNAARTYKDKVTESADPLMGVLKDIGGAAADAGTAIFDRFRRPPS